MLRLYWAVRTSIEYLEIGYIDLQKQLPNPAIGMDIIGEWTGTYYKRAIDGRTRSWVGSHPQISCRAHT